MISEARPPAGAMVLSEQVRYALRHYFDQLDGYPAADLHDMVIRAVEKPLLQTVLEQVAYNQTLAAQMLGLSRGTLRKKIAHYGLNLSDETSDERTDTD